MVEADTYCVDVLKQTYAVRRAIEKMESIMLDGHLRTCVVEGIKEGRDDAASLEEAQQTFDRFARALATQTGGRPADPADVQLALRGLCPIWPIC